MAWCGLLFRCHCAVHKFMGPNSVLPRLACPAALSNGIGHCASALARRGSRGQGGQPGRHSGRLQGGGGPRPRAAGPAARCGCAVERPCQPAGGAAGGAAGGRGHTVWPRPDRGESWCERGARTAGRSAVPAIGMPCSANAGQRAASCLGVLRERGRAQSISTCRAPKPGSRMGAATSGLDAEAFSARADWPWCAVPAGLPARPRAAPHPAGARRQGPQLPSCARCRRLASCCWA